MRRIFSKTIPFLLVFWLAVGCAAPQISNNNIPISVSILADGQTLNVKVNSGSTVAQALQQAGVTLDKLDRVEPPAYTLAQSNLPITVTRVREEFETAQSVLPFERQNVRSESLPEGETRLLQPGVNGLQEITTRRVLENGAEISRGVVKVVTLQAAQPEIVMVGAQTPFAAQPISGRLVYLSGGNAWLMEASSANRRPLTQEGDLDGRILRLSPDGNWLLFTRRSQKAPDEEINRLWALEVANPQAKALDLQVSNVVHFADFIPGTTTNITFSTVEPRAAAPGWQANNDLYTLKFSASGALGKPGQVIESNTGGIYGWWGSDYAWSPDGKRLAYARPDGIGLVSFRDNALVPLLDLTPLQTRRDWALIPGLAWGGDSRTLFFISHAAAPGALSPEESPHFDLGALSLLSGAQVALTREAGMFAYAAASAPDAAGNYQLAYLQALSPAQSENSRYRLVVMDRDGSNRATLFPPQGSPGLEPQIPRWSPQGNFIAILYQGNLWLIDLASAQPAQVTGDGLIQKIDWR
ncbi:MAG: hypothetical protein OHK0031_03610 [Anaerolineales bacterium]